jgi:hypothetical protein
MRFMMMVRAAESSAPPPQALADAVEQNMQEAVSNGSMVMAGGLAPMAQTHRVRLSGGKVSLLDGPFAETKEVVGGFAIMDFPSLQEALQAAKDSIELTKKHWPQWEGETEVRQIYGADDFPPQR